MTAAALLAAVLLSASPSAPADWDCTGRPGWPAGFQGEFVFVPASDGNARQLAADRAREEIISRVCGAMDCPSLRSEVVLWKSGEAKGTACALVLLENARVAAWRRSITAQDLEPQLAEVVRGLFAQAAPAPAGGKPRAVAIDKVNDSGVAGGARADWLRDRLAAALASQPGVELREVPAGWADSGVPSGLDAVLFASAFERQEGQEEVLEVNWKARFASRGGAYLRAAPPVYVPVAVAPPGPAFGSRGLLEDPSLSVRLSTPAGGSLCPGESAKLQLWSAEDRHFLVFNLYGKDQALLLFPSAEHPEGLVKAGQTLTLGPPQGLTAAPVGDTGAERFLVLAAPTKDALGSLARFTGQCRLPDAEARRVWSPERLPASIRKAMDGYRITAGERCQGLTPVDPAVLQQALAQIPLCRPGKR
jgi:hypothetical protein